MKTVTEYYNISDREIKRLAETRNPYWLKVRDFWWQIKDRDVQSLSQAQASWLGNIEEEIDINYRPAWMREEYEKERQEADAILD